MIQINELRIGNIVQVVNPEYHPKLLNVPLVVGGISPALTPLDCKPTFSISLENLNQEPNTFYENCSQFIKYVFPIPLTEEILLKCGFEREGCTYNSLLLKLWESTYEKAFQFRWYYTGYDTAKNVNLRSLHELQNLVFDLTGQELSVQL